MSSALYLNGSVEIRYLNSIGDPAWEDMQKVHNIILRRRYNFSFPAPAPGRHVFAIRSYNRLGIASEFSARISIILTPEAVKSLPRDEATLGWPGLDSEFAFKDENNFLVASSSATWRDLQDSWRELASTWKQLLPAKKILIYTTPTIDLGTIKPIIPIYQITAHGQFNINWRYSDTLPCEGEFSSISDTGENTRFVQFQIKVQGGKSTIPKLLHLIIDEQ